MAKYKLLLADDSVTIQKVVNLTFADEGIEVTAVGDGDTAMQKFVESVPDLVMVDVNMPGVDGYRICEMIKQDEETKHIPVILLVGSFEPFDEDEARRVGADDFLTKPFQSIRQLVNKVSDLLNGKENGTFSGETAVVNSFDDTLEMPPPVEETSATEIFGDSGMDDDLIQTNQIGSLPVNEAQKFESSAPDSSIIGEADLSFEAENFDEDFVETPTEEPLSENDSAPESQSDEIAADSVNDDEEPLPRHENIYEFADEQESSHEKIETAEIEIDEVETEYSLPEDIAAVEPENEVKEPVVEETAPIEIDEIKVSPTFDTKQGFELDDFDLLEVPQHKKFGSEKLRASYKQLSITGVQTASENLSPEDIEAIADKVVEKLSDRVIKKIVREVFAQMTKKK